MSTSPAGSIPTRPFGRHTDVRISALGFGGHHLGGAEDQTTAVRLVQEAVDGGITFFDNCWEYHLGKSEAWMGAGLRGRQMGVLGMKSLGGSGEIVRFGVATAQEALRYAMSLPVSTTISGIDSLDVLHQNLAVAQGFVPMTPEDMQALREHGRPFAANGHAELFKTTKLYDAKEGRIQHHFPEAAELPL